jgi:MmyB-like transcription regulator ligand binding domain
VVARMIIGLVVTAAAFAVAGQRLWWLKRLATSGQPAPERLEYARAHVASGFRTQLTEVIGQRKLLKWSAPGTAHDVLGIRASMVTWWASPGLRAATGRDPSDVVLAALIRDLSNESEEFRALWAAHNVESRARWSPTPAPRNSSWAEHRSSVTLNGAMKGRRALRPTMKTFDER